MNVYVCVCVWLCAHACLCVWWLWNICPYHQPSERFCFCALARIKSVLLNTDGQCKFSDTQLILGDFTVTKPKPHLRKDQKKLSTGEYVPWYSSRHLKGCELNEENELRIFGLVCNFCTLHFDFVYPSGIKSKHMFGSLAHPKRVWIDYQDDNFRETNAPTRTG